MLYEVITMKGNTGDQFRCSYHAWTFQHDGRLKNIPMMDSGYRDTRFSRNNPDCNIKRAARVESYRGFVFARFPPVTVQKLPHFAPS